LSLVAITEEATAQIGFKMYTIITQAKEIMEQKQYILAAYPPSLHILPSSIYSINMHNHCKEAWMTFWWKKVAHVILHPITSLSLTLTLQLIIESPLSDGMNVICKQTMINTIIELGKLDVKERIIASEKISIYVSSSYYYITKYSKYSMN